jgi:hypothetical protein
MTEDSESGPPSHTRSVVFETLADFWCEAAVLVAVFGLLDKILNADGLPLAWALKALGCAIVFLSLGAVLKVLAR